MGSILEAGGKRDLGDALILVDKARRAALDQLGQRVRCGGLRQHEHLRARVALQDRANVTRAVQLLAGMQAEQADIRHVITDGAGDLAYFRGDCQHFISALIERGRQGFRQHQLLIADEYLHLVAPSRDRRGEVSKRLPAH